MIREQQKWLHCILVQWYCSHYGKITWWEPWVLSQLQSSHERVTWFSPSHGMTLPFLQKETDLQTALLNAKIVSLSWFWPQLINLMSLSSYVVDRAPESEPRYMMYLPKKGADHMQLNSSTLQIQTFSTKLGLDRLAPDYALIGSYRSSWAVVVPMLHQMPGLRLIGHKMHLAFLCISCSLCNWWRVSTWGWQGGLQCSRGLWLCSEVEIHFDDLQIYNCW